MPGLPDHLLMRDYVKARDAGDAAGADRAWEQLVESNFDRIEGLAFAFRYPSGSRPSPELAEEACDDAYMRARTMGATFRGHHVGELYAALKRVVWFASMDRGRRFLKDDRHEAGSLDAAWDADSDTTPFDDVLAAYDDQLQAQAADSEQRAHDIGLAHWAIGQIPNDDQREVLTLLIIDEIPAAEVATRLGLTMDNLYQRRSRGMKALGKILRDDLR